MPITKEEFGKGRAIPQSERAIEKFLKSHRDEAFALSEIAKGLGYSVGTNFWNDVVVLFALQADLDRLIKDKKAISRQIAETRYFRAA